jgi:8-oxo-dGTP diphosphatase
MQTPPPPEPLLLSVDCVVFGLDDEDVKILLIQRKYPPFKGRWALPGGFVAPNEGLQAAAARELEEEAGLKGIWMEQLQAFGEPGRDPRSRVVTVAFQALVNLLQHPPQAASDAEDAAWFPLADLPTLAFDHAEILAAAHRRLRENIRRSPAGFELLPPKFTLTQLQRLHEKVLGAALDKRNFRKRVERLGVLKPLDEFQKDVAHRAAQLYSFDAAAWRRLQRQGLEPEL